MIQLVLRKLAFFRKFQRHPIVVGLLTTVLAVAILTIGVGSWYGETPPLPASPLPVVEVPIRPVEKHAPEEAERVIVTLRWGHTADEGDAPKALTGTEKLTAQGTQWDGYLALDCGEIERVEPLGLEADGAQAESDRKNEDDRVGPVVRGDEGDQRVYWRSHTQADWDGLRATLALCRSDAADGASTLRIVTPQKTYVARLDWSVDDFVSLRAERAGETLDVHMASTRNRRRIPDARVTTAPLQVHTGALATAPGAQNPSATEASAE